MRYLCLCLCLCLLITLPSNAEQTTSFYQYVKQLRVDAQARGISDSTVKAALEQVKLFKRAIHHNKVNQQKHQTLDTYLPAKVPGWKIAKARQLYKQNLPLLKQISKQYDIAPRYLIAIWGMETNFSQNISNYPALSVLVSLAYSEPANTNYREQIYAVLKAVDQKPNHLSNFKSDWSGKLGMLNFSAVDYLNNGQDFDQDGFSDIWQSKSDTFSSLAKFLTDNGWNNDLTWGRQVKLPDDFDSSLIGLAAQKSLQQWQELGVRRFNGKNLPSVALKASLVAPDGINGRIFLAYDNYNVLLKWQDSQYFVSAVGYLADRIKFPAIK